MAKNRALEREWRARLKRQRSSGLTIKAFCEQEGVPAGRFSWWRRELARRDGQSGAPRRSRTAQRQGRPSTRQASSRTSKPPRFVPVEVRTADRPGAPLEIVLADPPRIAVTAGFDPQLLGDVLRVLEARSC